MKIQKVLCAVDLSDASDQVVWGAIQLAESQNAKLTFIHVMHAVSGGAVVTALPELGGPRASGESSPAADDARSHALARMEGWRLPASERVKAGVELEVAVGEPAAELLSFAGNGGYDVLVIGKSGQSGFLKSLLGSISYKVVRNAPCSVLVVRIQEQGR